MGYRNTALFTATMMGSKFELVDEDIHLHENWTCEAGELFYFTQKEGEKELLYHNTCQEIVKVKKNHENKMIMEVHDFFLSLYSYSLSVRY